MRYLVKPHPQPVHQIKMATPGKDGKVVVTEIKGDLFSCPETSSMAHCVSADLHMGRGIATAFKKTFGRVEELKAQGTLATLAFPSPGIITVKLP